MLEEIEGRVTKKICQDFSRIESQIMDALSRLGDFLLYPQVRVQSGTVSGTSRNADVENQEPTEDSSYNDPHPEVGGFINWSSQSMDSDPKETS